MSSQQHNEELKEYNNFVSDVREAMAFPGTKKLLMHILELSNVNGNNFGEDGRTTEFRLGRASIGHDVLALMEDVDPTIYPTLLLERAREVQNERASKPDKPRSDEPYPDSDGQ